MDKKILNVNLINFAKMDKGGDGKTLIHQKWIICYFKLFITKICALVVKKSVLSQSCAFWEQF